MFRLVLSTDYTEPAQRQKFVSNGPDFLCCVVGLLNQLKSYELTTDTMGILLKALSDLAIQGTDSDRAVVKLSDWTDDMNIVLLLTRGSAPNVRIASEISS